VDRATMEGSPTAAIDVVVRWGDWVLAAHELSPPRPFFVGEQNADVLVPSEILGARRLPLLLVRWDGDVRLVVPKNARLLFGSQTKRMTAARMIARGFAQASSTLPQSAEVPFVPGQTATLFLGAVAIDFNFSTAAPRVERKPLFEKRLVWAQTASLAVHALLIGLLFFVIGPAEVDVDYGMTADQLNEFQRRIWRLQRKENQMRWELDAYEERARSRERLDEAGAAKERAWMDSLGAASNRWTEELAAEAQRKEGTGNGDDGLIGVLYDWPAPPPPPKQRLTIDDVMKLPPVVLPGEQPTRPGRRNVGPQVRMGAVSVSGRLPPEVIQRIVRQNFGRFRLCYEKGLRRNPNLQGRVAVRFVIGRDGATSNIGNGGSDLPDYGVVRCVIGEFFNLEFPQPQGGIVTVVYPVMFSPGD
jgi:hypothetical protein